jgi:hypothetical protein
MLRFFVRLFNSFYKLPILPPRVLKIFLGYLNVFLAYMCSFLGHRVLRLNCKPLRLIHKLHGFFDVLVAHTFSYAFWGF